jgi:hypothetical protein
MTLEKLIETATRDAHKEQSPMAIFNLNPFNPMYVIRHWRPSYDTPEGSKGLVRRIDPPQLMHPNQHEKNEWSRMANAAYAVMRNDIGHTYSAAASLPRDGTMLAARFYKLQDAYRAWLVFDEFPADGFAS